MLSAIACALKQCVSKNMVFGSSRYWLLLLVPNDFANKEQFCALLLYLFNFSTIYRSRAQNSNKEGLKSFSDNDVSTLCRCIWPLPAETSLARCGRWCTKGPQELRIAAQQWLEERRLSIMYLKNANLLHCK